MSGNYDLVEKTIFDYLTTPLIWASRGWGVDLEGKSVLFENIP